MMGTTCIFHTEEAVFECCCCGEKFTSDSEPDKCKKCDTKFVNMEFDYEEPKKIKKIS